MTLTNDDLRLASELFRIQAPQPLTQRFICCWTAFMNLCKVLSRRDGLRSHFGLRQNGTLCVQQKDAFKMAEVFAPAESAQLDHAFAHFSQDLNRRLILHENTRFFVRRTPMYAGKPVQRDAYRQRLNGVLDLERTLDPRYPAWCPINGKRYETYLRTSPADIIDEATSGILARQILDMLNAIYHNLLYGGETDGENSLQVLEKAIPLLEMIVQSLLEAFYPHAT
ncbi:MAG: hypothetical protein JXA21_21575 [Anaerolineae bacterium]|nr:hypothetical protein [Anaerolineae bacterium]